MAVHLGRQAPILSERMNVNDAESFWMCWADKLNGAEITLSEWTLPDGFVQVSHTTNGSVVDDDKVVRLNSNSVTITTTNTDGMHYISNTIETNDNRIITRGFYVVLDQTT